MIEYINNNPLKMIVFFILLSGGIIYLSLKLKQLKNIFFILVFYIPLSFASGAGCLAMHMAIIIFLLSLIFDPQEKKIEYSFFEKVLIILLLITPILSFINIDDIAPFFNDRGKLRLSKEYWVVLSMLSNIALYYLTKKYVNTKEDVLKILKIMAISATIASIAGYIQWLCPGHDFIFKYIVISDNPVWQRRVAATMQGYEMLAEYTAIIIIFLGILCFLEKKKFYKLFYIALILNAFIIMTLTQTRGIYISIAISILYLICLLFLTGKINLSIKYMIGSLLVFATLIALIFLIDRIRPESHFVERFLRFKETVNIHKKYFGSRTGAWMWGIQIISKMSPLEKMFGSGCKHFPISKSKIYGENKGWPHCLYLSYIIRDGFVGLSVFLLFLFWLYTKSIIPFLNYKKLKDKELFIIGAGLHWGLIIFLIDEIKIEFIRSDRSQNIYWVFFGLIVVGASLIKRDINKEPQ